MKRMILLLFLPFLFACAQSKTPVITESSTAYTIEPFYSDLSFDQPLYIAFTPPDDRTFIVERTGHIYEIVNDEKKLFLNLSETIDASGQEQGLLGLAFHPNFSKNDTFFVNYTADGKTFVSRFIGQHEDVLIFFNQPYSNHNGGHLAFGPDGYLYIATGDGGSAGDPANNAQNQKSLLGKILRLDVSKKEAQPEIFASGLRNPWRFSFDKEKGTLWAGDVGQDAFEEINIIEEGGNYGWNAYEGSHLFNENAFKDDTPYQFPVWEYGHSFGQSITGGYIYRGVALPGLEGMYIYGDFVSGTIWALELDGNTTVKNHQLLQTNLKIASFGENTSGDIFIVDLSGKIYQLQTGN